MSAATESKAAYFSRDYLEVTQTLSKFPGCTAVSQIGIAAAILAALTVAAPRNLIAFNAASFDFKRKEIAWKFKKTRFLFHR